MEFSISELLDALPEVDVDIQAAPGASVNRIKELTMKKVHSENKKKRRSLSGLTKVLLAAAVIASLALPVMAAQFGFTDWLTGLLQPGDSYDTDLALGSDSKSWELSGWVVELEAEEVSGNGLTVVYTHRNNEARPQSGTLETDESYWIEIWNGNGYERLAAPQKEAAEGNVIPIQAGTTGKWTVDWTDTYGTVEPGSYRLGKNFRCSAEDGTQETIAAYVKFRVFSQDMAPVMEDCRAQIERLREKDSYHIVETGYPELSVYDHYTIHYYKYGNDYLVERQYMQADGSLAQRDGYLYRDGKGYALTWEGETLAESESADWLDETQRDMWTLPLEIYDTNVGQVTVEGNQTVLLSGIAFADGQEDRFTELCFVRNEQGELIRAALGVIPGTEYTSDQVKLENVVEVQDTEEEEIARIIAAQAVE